MISARGITKRYGRLRVLSDVDIDIPRGTVTAIIGPNSSGKTTFNKVLLGLVRADAGTIQFCGAVVNGASAYRARIGYMQQAPRFPENLSADDVMRLLTDVRGDVGVRDEQLIDELELSPVLAAPLGKLSGGMRQRVNAALAFLFSPELLILDEPTAALDPRASAALKDKIRRDRDQGRTFVLTSHVLSELEELADRVVFLLEGRVVYQGSTADLLASAGATSLERAAAHLMELDRRDALTLAGV